MANSGQLEKKSAGQKKGDREYLKGPEKNRYGEHLPDLMMRPSLR